MRAAAAALVILTTSCGPPSPAPAIDPRLAARVPEDTSAIAGLDLTALRASPLFAKLPHATGDARYTLIAFRGGEVATITLGADGTAAGGTTHHPRSPLLTDAEPLAAHNPIWAVIRGGTVLPLQGNLANVNNLLRGVDLLTLAARPGDGVTVDLVARCPTPEAAREFEGSFRAVLLLSKVAQTIRMQREDRTVTATLAATGDTLGPLMR